MPRRGNGLVLFLALAWLAIPALARAQISPGKLSRAHQDLEGVRNCTRCHSGGNASADDKCLACHEGIAYLREAGRGFHARLGDATCASCHPEHAGRDFELVAWDEGSPKDFDHARTGWPLTGAHARAECRDCHRAERQTRNITLRMQSKDPSKSWLGLDPACSGCHADVHATKLGANCAECHGTEQWHGVKDFDHARTGYALAGAHAKVDCAKCHENGRFARSKRSKATWVLKGLATDDCGACHRDVHDGRFGKECAKCHVVEGFRVVSSSTFDHDRTRYPLRGAHRKVRCARCHDAAEGGWGKKPAFGRCDGCHVDPHAGEATLAGSKVDCDGCHSLDSFRHSTFDVAQHARTRYPLEGKHASVACAKCHRPADPPSDLGKAGVRFHPDFARCEDCHADAHGGQLTGQAARCERCHDPSGFRPAAHFGVAEHRDTDFPLVGAHAKVECAHCHASERKGLAPLDRARLGKADFAMRGVETECRQCHVDVHGGRYGPDAPEARRFTCEGCHTVDAFRPSLVDVKIHHRFAFALEGGHRATPCILCHTNLQAEPLSSTLIRGPDAQVRRDFQGVPTACETCHTQGVPR